ncbi:DNA sulfur modification protein DndE [Flavobacterium sp. 316]|uniref:DndE family protein n=1 Tax=Flavobacterium sp. 316 TaxID=1603293 RepID=UPI0005E71553|nr:DndE family protein [Flavobacterium sp. 316]KIX19895.1 DNA sulfur modification protein DndE [Flavobacterium sp. 316]
MFNQISTSKDNKEIVTLLTRKLNLGTENIIARIAYSYSLSQNKVLDLNQIKDSQGKSYSKSVLFGDFFDIYIGLICVKYNLYKTDKDLPRYIKMHIDDGLELLNEEINNQSNLDGFDFLSEKIQKNLVNF